MTTSDPLRLSKSERDLLLSLGNSQILEFLAQLKPAAQRSVLAELEAHALAVGRPTSPAQFAAQVWGERWSLPPHLARLNEALVDLADRRLRRLIVTMPPRHGKSVLVSQFLPAWYVGSFPEHRVILTSYQADFAAGWGRKARDVLAAHGRRAFGVRMSAASTAANRWDLARREGGMTTAGVGGPITGRGADLLIVDDPVKNAEQAISETFRQKMWDWWTSTAFTRLEPDGVAVVVQTRWHEDDLAGRLQREQADEGWRVIRFPALAEENDPLGRVADEPLWPERFPTDALARIRGSIPAHWWESLYQQRPSRHESVLWPAEHFVGDDLWFDAWPDDLVLRVLALDPSKGTSEGRGDYSAYVLLGVDPREKLWVDADLSNLRPPMQLVADGVRLLAEFRPDAFRIEGNAWQDLLAPLFEQALRDQSLVRAWPEAIYNRTNKRLRIESLDRLLAARQIRFRRTPGAERLVGQLKEFPIARHDDGPDALEMAVRTAQELWSGEEQEIVAGTL
jgi:predicted phage terminase large subunit-like protein